MGENHFKLINSSGLLPHIVRPKMMKLIYEIQRWLSMVAQCAHADIKTYGSFLPLCLFQVLSPNASYLICSPYLSFYYSLHWPLSLLLCYFILYFLPFPRCWEFMCLVDPEAVNLVIHNQYQPHLFPTDKSGLSDNYIFLSSSSVKGWPFSPCFVLVPGILMLVLIRSVHIHWPRSET